MTCFLDIMDDIREECMKYGVVKSLEIPRSVPGMEITGVGKVGFFYVIKLSFRTQHCASIQLYSNRLFFKGFC